MPIIPCLSFHAYPGGEFGSPGGIVFVWWFAIVHPFLLRYSFGNASELPRYMYTICTVYVHYLYSNLLNIYCTYTEHILHINRARILADCQHILLVLDRAEPYLMIGI